ESLQRILLGAAIAAGILLLVVAITASVVPDQQQPLVLLQGALIGVGLFVTLGWTVDSNRVSPHYFYQDRLGETYLFTERREGDDHDHEYPPGSLTTVRNSV